MKARIISGLVLVAVTLSVLLWAPADVIAAIIALAILTCAWEWSAFLRPSGLGERFAFVATIALVLGAAWFFTTDPGGLRALLWVAAAWWVVALLWVLRGPDSMSRVGAWIAGVMVLVPAGVALAHLRLDLAAGEFWTIYVLVLVGVADTGAYFSGRAFGRHRLAPLVSPGKTWEGVAGGLLLAGLAAIAASWWFAQPVVPMVIIGLVVGGFSVVGDLMESLLKRYAGVKDSGNLIPGHGGLMDRLDSVTAAAPLLLLSAIELLEVAR